MLRRCRDKNHQAYKHYGGRGIAVCERWLKFVHFLADMGERPEGKTLDRKDTNGNYEPGNCQWSTQLEQTRNRRSNHIVTAHGITGCISEVAELLGVDPIKALMRLRAGWEPDRAFT